MMRRSWDTRTARFRELHTADGLPGRVMRRELPTIQGLDSPEDLERFEGMKGSLAIASDS